MTSINIGNKRFALSEPISKLKDILSLSSSFIIKLSSLDLQLDSTKFYIFADLENNVFSIAHEVIGPPKPKNFNAFDISAGTYEVRALDYLNLVNEVNIRDFYEKYSINKQCFLRLAVNDDNIELISLNIITQ